MEITSANRPIRRRNRQTKGLSASIKGQAKECPPKAIRDGFLNHSFLPIVAGLLYPQPHYTILEEEYFGSLLNLENLYLLKHYEDHSENFPLNILNSYKYACEQMAILKPNLKLLILQDEDNIATISTAIPFDTRHTLYYYQVEPLYNLLHDQNRKPTSQLLLSLFSYLFQVMEIPYFTQKGCYLNYMYGMVGEWINDSYYDDDAGLSVEREKEIELQHVQLENVESCGDFVLEEIKNISNIKEFGTRLRDFSPCTAVENSLKEVATIAFQLFCDYPTRSIKESIEYGLFEKKVDDDENYEGTIRVDNYLSFVWSKTDDIFDQLIDFVESELGEYYHTDEPLSFQLFNTPQIEQSHNQEFNARTFELLHLFADLLEDFDKEYKARNINLN